MAASKGNGAGNGKSQGEHKDRAIALEGLAFLVDPFRLIFDGALARRRRGIVRRAHGAMR